MLSSTKPRSHHARPFHTPSSSISSPLDIPVAPTSPYYSPSSTPPPGARRPSISTTMHWLSRSANSTQGSSSPYAPSKPVKISEPKLVRGIDALTHPRNGALGTGATVVRTPDDALREVGVRLTYDLKSNDTPKAHKPRKEKKASISKTITIPPSHLDYSTMSSPPLPPLPIPESDEENELSKSYESSTLRSRSPTKRSRDTANVTPPTAKLTVAPTPTPIPIPRSPSLRPSLKIRSTISSDEAVPPLPSAVPPSPCPPFKPMLMSEPPSFPTSNDNVIITIETCTATYKTSLETIRSRPSNLSSYIDSVLSKPQRSNSSTSSVYSNDEDHLATYRQHLISQGLVPHPYRNIHIFLDRPSAPYTHILSYLRSNPATPEYPEYIPRAVLYQQLAHARLESLIELRDEAAYLRLEGLHKMCVDEIRKLHAPKMHVRGNSVSSHSVSAQSMQASISTLQTLLERVETDARSSSHSLPLPHDNRIKERDNSMSDQSSTPSSRGPPTPQSWESGHTRNRSLPTQRSLKSPPVGWI
ncbi:hypothetical protein FA15DRAFT_757368 [Coprinopsis marcescibilis]|uniref:Uncharacterized protein n=1 Tax=Coprinopsis marcescibilis TaxID=230819 RepID=A0A5C3KS52_COPMA|nr:hypothetical protein FA15DRAFT_757368 [Coprinopsis marcescibilis]